MATLVYKCEKCKKVYEFITSIKEDKETLFRLNYKCADKECRGELKQQLTAPKFVIK